MPTRRTLHGDSDPPTTPVSRVENRVIPCGTVISARVGLRMALAHRMLAAFVIEANARLPELTAAIEVPGVGDLLVSDIHDFKLVDDSEANEISHTISFEYRGRWPLDYVTDSMEVYARIRKTLFNNRLQFKSVAGPTINKVSIAPHVPASVRIAARIIGGEINVTLHNVLVLGTADYVIPVERFDRAIVDALVDLVVNRSQTYHRLAIDFARRR